MQQRKIANIASRDLQYVWKLGRNTHFFRDRSTQIFNLNCRATFTNKHIQQEQQVRGNEGGFPSPPFSLTELHLSEDLVELLFRQLHTEPFDHLLDLSTPLAQIHADRFLNHYPVAKGLQNIDTNILEACPPDADLESHPQPPRFFDY